MLCFLPTFCEWKNSPFITLRPNTLDFFYRSLHVWLSPKMHAFSNEVAYDEMIMKSNPKIWECPSYVGLTYCRAQNKIIVHLIKCKPQILGGGRFLQLFVKSEWEGSYTYKVGLISLPLLRSRCKLLLLF